MKQLIEKKKKILIIIILALIILAGMLMTIFLGFNKEARFEQAKRIDIYVEQKVDLEKVKEKVKEVLGNDSIVQVVEVYQDMVTIRSKDITEEQKNEIVNKVKEIYEFEQTAEDTAINVIPTTRFRDLFKPYVIPFIIVSVLVIIYFMIRYYKLGILKVFVKTFLAILLGQILLFSILAITRISVGIYTPVLILMIYILVISMLDKHFRKNS